MTIIRPNSISGITSVTFSGGDITYYKSDGTRGNQFTHNVSSTGVITATKFVGPVEGNISGGTVAGSTGTFSGDVTISGDLGVAGTLTYEDVTRIDAVGLSTFREGFGVGPLAGIALTAYKDGSIRTSGIVTASSFSGTVASSNLSGALPALDGSALTGVGASFGNSSVNTSGIITATAFIPSAGQLSHRNIIINGDMSVAQRGTSDTSTNYFSTVDRWSFTANGQEENLTRSQESLSSSDTGPYELGFRNAWKVQNGNQTGGANAGDYVIPQYPVEARDLANSGWNYKSASSYITLSFWVKSSVAQTFYGFLRTITGTDQAYSFSYTLAANTWTKVTKTIPGLANGNIDVADDNTCGLIIFLPTYLGTDKTDAGNNLNTWAAYSGSNRTPNYTSTWWTTNDATWHLTGVQLEVGSVATPFEHRSYAEELKRCERYFQLLLHPDSGTEDMGSGFASSANEVQFPLQFKTEMRANPTVWQVSGSNYFLIGAGSYGGDKYLSASWNVNTVSKISGSLYTDPDANLSSHVSSMGLIQGKSTSARLGLQAEL